MAVSRMLVVALLAVGCARTSGAPPPPAEPLRPLGADGTIEARGWERHSLAPPPLPEPAQAKLAQTRSAPAKTAPTKTAPTKTAPTKSAPTKTAQAEAPATAAAAPDGGAPHAAATSATCDPNPPWPRIAADDGGPRVTLWPLEVVRWAGDRVTARAALAVALPNGPPTYATVELTARADVDKRGNLVRLDDVRAPPPAFATPPPRADFADAVARVLPRLVAVVALDRLQASLAAARPRPEPAALDGAPPRLLVATRPTVLIPIDGRPVLARADERFDRVLDTRALLLVDRARRQWYVYVGDAWYRADRLDGPWRTATLPPARLDALRRKLVAARLVDALDAPGTRLAEALDHGLVPELVVATTPTEVLELDGPPELSPIAGTDLLSVDNTDADLFLALADQRFYALVSGRWLAAPALDGPWSRVAPEALPEGFARIPPGHAHADARAAVPGTPIAADALAASLIPETATLRLADLALTVRYDGAPRFAPIAGTVLRYAVNTATPVIEVAAPLRAGVGGLYYAVADGVWFTASAPIGPWRPATSVPGALYALPASSPVYYAAHARLFGADDTTVRVGYTPAYLGAAVGRDGTAVWGTGYAYAPYVGRVWVGAPATWGFHARWHPRGGWTLGAAGRFAAPAQVHPWWGPMGWGWDRADAPPVAEADADVYARWGRAVVRRPLACDPEVRAAGVRDDLYAGRDGALYRSGRPSGATWERLDADGWRRVSSLRASAGATGPDPLARLERQRRARQPLVATAARPPHKEPTTKERTQRSQALQSFGAAEPCGQPAGVPSPWPRRVRVGDDDFRIYRPRVERAAGGRLEARAAVAVTSGNEARPAWGELALSAPLHVDAAKGTATLDDFAIDRARFPSRPGDEARLAGELGGDGDGGTSLPLGALDPVIAADGTLLAFADGAPRFCRMDDSGLLRVVDTRALVAVAPESGRVYLRADGRWWSAPGFGKPWSPATQLPSGLDTLADEADREHAVTPIAPPAEASHALLVSTPPRLPLPARAEVVDTAARRPLP